MVRVQALAGMNIASFADNEFRPHRFAQNENGFAQKSISRSN